MDHISWQDLSDNTDRTQIFKKSPSLVNGSQLKVSSILLDIPLRAPSMIVGYNDESICWWQFATDSEPTVVATWHGLHDYGEPSPGPKSGGLVMTAIGQSHLITGGTAKYLRRWDLATEQTLGDLSIGTDQTVTALSSNGLHNIVAGLEGGTVRLFDTRAEADGRVAVGPKHSNPVRAVSLRPDEMTLVSVCSEGTVHLIDLRKMIPAMKKWTWNNAPADVTIHRQLDLMAFAGSGSLEVYSIDGERKCALKDEEAACVDFHPTESVLGVARNSAIVLYGEWGR